MHLKMMLKLAGNSQREIRKTNGLIYPGVVRDPKIGSGVLYLSTRNDLGAFGIGTLFFFNFPLHEFPASFSIILKE